jgi:hypothetical protein
VFNRWSLEEGSPASAAQDAKQGDETAQFLTLLLAGEMFGINIPAATERTSSTTALRMSR